MNRYTKEKLQSAVLQCKTIADVCRLFGVKTGSGSAAHVANRIRNFGIDTSHFDSRNWANGKKRTFGRLTASEVFIKREGVKRRQAHSVLVRALLEVGVPHKCSCCKQPPHWNGKPLTLPIHHIDGDINNDTRENLIFLCLHCHTQTPNYGPKSRPKTVRLCSMCGTKIHRGKTGFCLRCFVKNKTHKKEIQNKCRTCGNDIGIRSTLCKKCTPRKRKVVRPSKNELEHLVWSMPTSKIAIQYGISDVAIAKWCKSYGITKPPRGYWAKQNSGE